jgi:hypothetical protein
MNIQQKMINRNTMTLAYINCAIFCDMPEDNSMVDFTIANLSQDALSKAYKDCESFYNSMHTQNCMPDNCDWRQIGIDFWYTRNSHGTGFWDNYKDEKNYNGNEDILTDIAQSFGECYLYLGDDNKLYID